MFDVSWGEMLILGSVALIVIGPKDLPQALRTVGQMIGKVRRMAGEFQGQFQDAMREAEVDSLRKEMEGVKTAAEDVNRLASDNSFDPSNNAISSMPEQTPASAMMDPIIPPPDPLPPLDIKSFGSVDAPATGDAEASAEVFLAADAKPKRRKPKAEPETVVAAPDAVPSAPVAAPAPIAPPPVEVTVPPVEVAADEPPARKPRTRKAKVEADAEGSAP